MAAQKNPVRNENLAAGEPHASIVDHREQLAVEAFELWVESQQRVAVECMRVELPIRRRSRKRRNQQRHSEALGKSAALRIALPGIEVMNLRVIARRAGVVGHDQQHCWLISLDRLSRNEEVVWPPITSVSRRSHLEGLARHHLFGPNGRSKGHRDQDYEAHRLNPTQLNATHTIALHFYVPEAARRRSA